MKNKEITVLDQEIHINKNDYFSLTDIARYKNSEAPADVVKNWLRRKDTIEFIGLWEKLNNPNFNVVEFDQFKNEAGHNYFTLSPKKWIDGVNAIGIISKAGKYNAGTYAHKDSPAPRIRYIKRYFIGNIFDFRTRLLIIAIIITFEDDGIAFILFDFAFFYQALLFGADTFKQNGGRLVGRILRNEFTLNR